MKKEATVGHRVALACYDMSPTTYITASSCPTSLYYNNNNNNNHINNNKNNNVHYTILHSVSSGAAGLWLSVRKPSKQTSPTCDHECIISSYIHICDAHISTTPLLWGQSSNQWSGSSCNIHPADFIIFEIPNIEINFYRYGLTFFFFFFIIHNKRGYTLDTIKDSVFF